MAMALKEAVEFLFTIAKEFKNFFESPVLLLTRVDYADKIFDALCEMRTAMIIENSTERVLDILANFHQSWLQAVRELEAFKKRVKETPRESIYQCVDFTIEAVDKRLKYFRQYIRSLETTLNDNLLQIMHTDMEIIEDMHAAIIAVLREKRVCLQNYTDATEFALKVSDECEEALNWLDKINDSVALRFSELVGGKVPELSNRLKQTLQQVVEGMRGTGRESVQRLVEELHLAERHLGSVMRTSASHDLEISKVMEKIATLNERIKHLSGGRSSALMALQHKKLYLEERLQSLLDIHSTLKTLHERSEGEDSGEYVPRGLIFNHKLPEGERDRLVAELVREWDVGVKARKGNRKSIISILSVAELRKEMYSDSMGQFFVDQFGRKLYTAEEVDSLYQVNENNELVPLADDEYHVYYYDDCGRYYLDQVQQRIYKAERDASEYILDTSGVMFKVREMRDGVVYHYDGYGRHYVDVRGRNIYRESDSASEYENDGLGNLVRLRRDSVDLEHCPDETLLTEESAYLRRSVGGALRACVADAVLHQPADPVLYLARRLLKYRADADERERRAREREELLAERELRIQEEKEAAERAEALEAARLRALLSAGASEASFDSNMVQYQSMAPDDYQRD